MPQLPTVFLTQAQADRAIAAFGTVANYRAWLRQQVKDYVVSKEMQALDAQHNANKQTQFATADADMTIDPNATA